MTFTYNSSTLQHYNVKRHQLTNECLKTFKLRCGKPYDASLWNCSNSGSVSKLRSCYNRCIKIFFGYKRRDSLTIALLKFGLSFDKVLNNAYASFWRLRNGCNSLVVANFRTLNKSLDVQTV